MIGRRDALKLLAASPWVVSGCAASTPAPKTESPAEAPRFTTDLTFARSLLSDGAKHDDLVRAPALAAVVRHRAISGGASDASAVLEQLIARARQQQEAARVLDIWKGGAQELDGAARAADVYLPADVRPKGAIFFIVGYDIAAASPPDIIVNAGHPHFVGNPSEVLHYVTHEAHHLGFLACRPMPKIETAIASRESLIDLVRYATQLEGMGVHVAYEPRRQSGTLAHDDDYVVYADPDKARGVQERYVAVYRRLKEAPFNDDLVGEVLTALSSGERLWYRFGALVAAKVERERGVDVLRASVRDPKAFTDAIDALIAATRS